MDTFMFGLCMAVIPAAVILIPTFVYFYLKGRRNTQGWKD